jgi:hypothetical protein
MLHPNTRGVRENLGSERRPASGDPVRPRHERSLVCHGGALAPIFGEVPLLMLQLLAMLARFRVTVLHGAGVIFNPMLISILWAAGAARYAYTPLSRTIVPPTPDSVVNG